MKRFLYISLFLLSIPLISLARPAKPGVITVRQPDGTPLNIILEGDESGHLVFSEDGQLLRKDEKGFYVKDTSSDVNQKRKRHAMRRASRNVATGSTRSVTNGLMPTGFPVKGDQKSLVILVEFQNLKFTLPNPRDFFYRMLNEEGFSDHGATGSVRDYYVENSAGQFRPEFDVFGPVTVSKKYEYYGANDPEYDFDMYPHEMVIEACRLVDKNVNFADYDLNGDGLIDNVYIFYAGYGEADGGDPDTIWPHAWDLSSIMAGNYRFDGKRLEHYACSNELQFFDDSPDGIGSFVHEFSHVMGFPDLYATEYSDSFTPGWWDVMDAGCYNNDSRTPPNYSSYELYSFGWLEPDILPEAGKCTLPNLIDSRKAYLAPTENPSEFFMFENRQQTGNDTYIPGHGMLVWHIHYDENVWWENTVNNNPRHNYVDLIEADDIRDYETDADDAFPGGAGVTAFTAETSPAFVSWKGRAVGNGIVEIAESPDGIISFRVLGEETEDPGDDEPGDDNPGQDDPGNDDPGQDDEEDAAVGNIIDSGSLIINGTSVSLLSGNGTVYDIAGRKIAEISTEPVTLPRGIYILVSGQLKTKFIL